jgi:hypothetical protein
VAGRRSQVAGTSRKQIGRTAPRPALILAFCLLLVPAFALDREAFTFTNYDLDVRVEPEQQRLAVRGKLALRNDSATPQKNLVLQISSSLDWRSIQVNGKPAQFVSQPYTSDIDHTGSLSEAVVNLPQQVPPKGTVELEIGYEGVIPLDATRLTRIGVPEDAAKHSDWDQIGKSSTAVRGIGYVVWYPVATDSANLSEANSVFETVARWKAQEAKSKMQVKLCNLQAQPPFQTATMNDPMPIGVPAGIEGGITDGKSYACEEHSFAALDATVPAFAIGLYSVLDRPTAHIYYFATHKSAADDYALALELATPFVTEWFGAPNLKFRIVELADTDSAPFESGSILFTPLAHSDSRLAQMTVVHQLTHAGFPSARPWIYEGLAHFVQAADLERQSGRQAALEFMGLHRTVLADAEKALAQEKKPNTAADQSLINTSSEEFYRSKAMFVWWMLRDMIGEPALKKALAEYHPEQDREPSYVQHLVEAQTKQDLEWFFDDWVYRDRGLPDFKVDSAVQRPTVAGGAIVTINVSNLGDAGAEVPVTLRMEGGEATKRLQVPARSTATVRIEAAAMPLEVVVNDGSVPESDGSNNVFKIETTAR